MKQLASLFVVAVTNTSLFHRLTSCSEKFY